MPPLVVTGAKGQPCLLWSGPGPRRGLSAGLLLLLLPIGGHLRVCALRTWVCISKTLDCTKAVTHRQHTLICAVWCSSCWQSTPWATPPMQVFDKVCCGTGGSGRKLLSFLFLVNDVGVVGSINQPAYAVHSGRKVSIRCGTIGSSFETAAPASTPSPSTVGHPLAELRRTVWVLHLTGTGSCVTQRPQWGPATPILLQAGLETDVQASLLSVLDVFPIKLPQPSWL